MYMCAVRFEFGGKKACFSMRPMAPDLSNHK